MKPFKEIREHSENELELGDGWGKVRRTKCAVTSGGFSSEKASGAGLNFKNIIWYVSDQAQCMTLVVVAWLRGGDTYCINKAEESHGGEVRTATLGIHLPVSFSCHLGSQGQGQRHSAELTGTCCNEMVYMVIPLSPHPVYVSWRSICYQPPCFWKVILLSKPHLLPETLWQVTAAHWRSSGLPWCQRSCPVRCRFRGWCQRLCRAVASPHSYRMF